jgi:hypothetical protein
MARSSCATSVHSAGSADACTAAADGPHTETAVPAETTQTTAAHSSATTTGMS